MVENILGIDTKKVFEFTKVLSADDVEIFEDA